MALWDLNWEMQRKIKDARREARRWEGQRWPWGKLILEVNKNFK